MEETDKVKAAKISKLEHPDANTTKSNKAEKSDKDSCDFSFSESPSLEDIRRLQAEFCSERNWDQYHTPRNLLLAMMGEVGELAEIFQWKGEVPVGVPSFTEEEKKHLGQEMSDILVYLIRMADKCEVDLPKAVLDKIEVNRSKYPAEKVYGKSHKYTAYNSK